MRDVIVNSTPMIILSKIGMLDILHKMYGNVIIPQAVFDEVTVKEHIQAILMNIHGAVIGAPKSFVPQ